MADEAFEVSWDGDKVMAALRAASYDGLLLGAEHLLTVSSQLAPHEEGDLERSGEVSGDENDMTVAVSYDRPYAVVQHEDMNLLHDAGKQAKYLEDPMNDEQDTMLDLLASKPRKLF
jgi:hypothetical protein